MSDVYHGELRELAKGLARARTVASRLARRARLISHGNDVEGRRSIPMAVVETSAPRIVSRVGECGSETDGREK
jgi:hypothetical protein